MLAGVTVKEVYGHWILYYDGKYYDPEFGVMDALYQKAEFNHIWRFLLMKNNGLWSNEMLSIQKILKYI